MFLGLASAGRTSDMTALELTFIIDNQPPILLRCDLKLSVVPII